MLPDEVAGFKPSAGLADRVDQIPLAHLRAAGDPELLGFLVDLLPVAVLESVAGLAVATCVTSVCDFRR
jgi:hypothetical protein